MNKLDMFEFTFYLQRIRLDTIEPWGLIFQDVSAPQLEGLEELHNNIMYYLAIISFGLGWILISTIINYKNAKKFNKYSNHGTIIELIFITVPGLILVLIGFYSFKLLYLMDEVIDPSLVIQGEGHEWYWSCQHSDFANDVEEYGQFIFNSDNSSGNTPFSRWIPQGNPFEGNPFGGGRGYTPNPNTSVPSSIHAMEPRAYADDYLIEQKYYRLKVNYNDHVYGTVSNHPFKDLDPSFLQSEYKVVYETYAGKNRNNSPIKELPTEASGLAEYVSREGGQLSGELNGFNYSDTIYHYNKLASYRSQHTPHGWGVDNTIASLERDWERYDHRGFNIIKRVRDFRVHESLHRRLNPNYTSPLSKQFFEVD